MTRQSLRVVPAVETTGISYARGGTAVAAAICVASWLSRELLVDTPLAELPQISTAALVLGFIGIAHVERRARKLGLSR